MSVDWWDVLGNWRGQHDSRCLIFFFFNLSFIYLLYNIVLVLPYIDMNPPWVYMCSPS